VTCLWRGRKIREEPALPGGRAASRGPSQRERKPAREVGRCGSESVATLVWMLLVGEICVAASRARDATAAPENFRCVRRNRLETVFAGLISAERRTSARANPRLEEGDRDEQAASCTPRERVCSVRAADSHNRSGRADSRQRTGAGEIRLLRRVERPRHRLPGPRRPWRPGRLLHRW